VIGAGVVAQVKLEGVSTDRSAVQQRHGEGTARRCDAAFASLAGYTAQAVEWVSRAHVTLITLDRTGVPVPVGNSATALPTPLEQERRCELESYHLRWLWHPML